MKPISMQCDRMARVAAEFCTMIEGFGHQSPDGVWLQDMEKLLPRLHVAATALASPEDTRHEYCLPDDDQRCELYLRLHERLQAEPRLKAGAPGRHQAVCDRLADDFTDMYFDLNRGLELLQACPDEPEGAECNWLCSFYLHWGQHLLDAEYWLRSMDARNNSAGRILAWSYEDQDHHRE
jgi:hypothetical protein